MLQFKDLVANVINNGKLHSNPKGNAKSILGATVRYDVRTHLPVITGKKTNIKWAMVEMAMFLKGEHHTDYLAKYGCEKIWEKQSLSEDVTNRSPRNPHDVTAEYAEKKGISLEEAKNILMEKTKEYQEKTEEINKRYSPESGVELDMKGYMDEIAQANVELEKIFKADGVALYDDKVVFSKGELGPIYGTQWRKWLAVNPSDHQLIQLDQIQEIIWKLKNVPDSRQIILSAWNPAVIARETFSYDEKIRAGFMGQPPCHVMSQFLSHEVEGSDKRELTCIVQIRSNDLMLGHPFNIVGYAVFMHLLAAHVDMVAGELVVQIGDAHVYEDHLEGAKQYLYDTEVKTPPTFQLAEGIDILNFEPEDLFAAVGEYESGEYIPFDIKV